MMDKQNVVCTHGVQDTLSPNTAPWQNEQFKLKEFEKMAEAGRCL